MCLTVWLRRASRRLLPAGSVLCNCFGHENAVAEYVVVTLPLTAQTESLVNAEAIAAMRPDAVLLNVSRGPMVNEQALYDALVAQKIGGAVIDTWYQYPTPDAPKRAPSRFDFAALGNVWMTRHMSDWTTWPNPRRHAELDPESMSLSCCRAARSQIRDRQSAWQAPHRASRTTAFERRPRQWRRAACARWSAAAPSGRCR